MFEQQSVAFGYFLRPDAAAEERVYQQLPSTATQLAPLLGSYLDAYNTRFNTNLNLGRLLGCHCHSAQPPYLHVTFPRLGNLLWHHCHPAGKAALALLSFG